MKKKQITLLLTAFCMAGAIALPVACGEEAAPEEVKLELSDWLYWDTLYVNEEYDASGLIQEEEGVEYSILRCIYFDESFTRHDIQATGMTFTQTEPYNVVLELQAKKGEAVDSDVVELDVNFRTNEVIDEIMGSYNDEGVAKSVTAKSEYLKDGASVALAARYVGNRNPAAPNGMTVGIFQNSWTACSVTDWENAVLSVDVYNPNDFTVRFGPQWYSPNDATWNIQVDGEVPANSWAHLEWSFRKWGFDVNYFEAGGQIYFKMAIKDEPDYAATRDYTIYLCNFDVANYDAEKSPDLDTTKPEVDPEPTTNGGKILDAMSKTYRDAEAVPDRMKTEITREYGEQYRKGGEFALKVTNSGTFNPAGQGSGVGICFLAGNEFFSATDWSNAVLSIDVFNASDIDLKFGAQFTVGPDEHVADISYRLPAGEWTHIDWSLRRIGYASFAQDSIYFKVGTWADAPDTQQDYTVYLSNVDVSDYSAEKFPDLETRTDGEIADAEWEAIPGDELDKKIAYKTVRSGNFTAETDTEVYCDQVEGSASSVKFTFTQDSDVVRGTLFTDGDMAVFGDLGEIDWDNLYIGFYLKTSGALNLAVFFQNTQNGTVWNGAQGLYFMGYGTNKDIAANDGWQYIEFNVSDLMKDMAGKYPDSYSPLFTSGVTAYKFALCNESSIGNGNSVSFYLDGFSIYSKKPQTNSDRALAAIDNTYKDGGDRSIVTDPVTGEGATSLKFEYSGTINPAGNNGLTLGLLTGAGYFSVTDWSNAVLVLDIYNPQDYDLKFVMQISPTVADPWYFTAKQKLEAGKWTHLEIRLSDVCDGYTEFKEGSIYLKVGTWEDAPNTQQNYTLYLCNIDVIDGQQSD